MSLRSFAALWVALLATVCVGKWGLGDEAPKPDTKDATKELKTEDYELFQVFADTLDQVQRNYVKDISRRQLMEAAIRGVLEELDPYSNYIPPEQITRFKTSVDQEFGGIGIQVELRNDELTIISPLYGTPAYRAGLHAGDKIVEIEGESTDGITLDKAVEKLKGATGTPVKLTIERPYNGSRETLSVTREMIQLETVLGDQRKEDDTWEFMLDEENKLGYIRLTAFSRETADDLREALRSLRARELRGLVLDLRFNPGGLLSSAIEVADLFVSEGRIVSTEGRNTQARTWEARKRGTFEGFPVAILVNRYSASASEIVSACLQDHKRAVVIGERSWGKGSVQNVIELEGGRSALKLTTASYQRPSGKNIHRFPDSKESDEWGVIPDDGFELRLNDGEIRRLVEYRRDRDILRWTPPEERKADDVAKNDTPSGDKPAGDKPADEKQADAKPETTPTTTEPKPDAAAPTGDSKSPPTEKEPQEGRGGRRGPFVDRQLQKALEYLRGELAKAA
jgi:carboxyl-terminal processing protease